MFQKFMALALSSIIPISSALAEESGQRLETMTVTGSHIKRVDVEGIAPVETVSRKEIERSGHDSVADVLRDTGANTFGSQREQSGVSTAGNAEVSLRGLGSENTLVLLNGQRLPTDAISGAVDLNMIPIAAVERVEILKDGASAIYGSDALGGVVNVITRKDFSGTEASITQTIPDGKYKGGAQTNVGLVNGINTERLNVITVITYRYNQGVIDSQRPWTSTELSKTGNPGTYIGGSGLTSNPDGSVNTTNWSPTGKFKADPNCPANLLITINGNTYCQYNYSPIKWMLPNISQLSGMVDANAELSSTWKLNARAGITHRLVKWTYAPSPDSFFFRGGALVNSYGLPGITAGQDLQVNYRLTDLGSRDSENTTNGYNFVASATNQLGHDWTLDLNATHNVVTGEDRGVNGYGLRSAFQANLADGSFNPFSTSSTGKNLTGVKYIPSEKTLSLISGFEAGATGPIMETVEGTTSLAVGVSANLEKFEDIFDAQSSAGNVFGNAGSNGAGHRIREAAYAELSQPLFDKKVELQLAGRFDNYSDFGSTLNPKVGFSYHVSKTVMIRGSWGTGFKAPKMQDLYSAQTDGNPTFLDEKGCSIARASGIAADIKYYCSEEQYHVISGGNPGLKQSNSVAYTLGVVADPVQDLSITTDLFMTKITGVPGIDLHDLTLAEKNGTDPTKYGVYTHRDTSTGYLRADTDSSPGAAIIAPLQNLGEKSIAGVDFGVTYKMGKWQFATEQNQQFYYKEEGFPGAGVVDKLGWHSLPAWKNTTSVDYALNEHHSFGLSASTIPGQLNSAKDQKSDSFTSFDFTYGYKAKDIGEFSFGIHNMFATLPPLDTSSPTDAFDATLYDPNIRSFLVGYKRTF